MRMPAGKSARPFGSNTIFLVAGVPIAVIDTTLNAVSRAVESTRPRSTASAGRLSDQASRRYRARSLSSARTTPLVMSRSCTPFPSWSRASIVYASHRPPSSNSHSATLPTLTVSAPPSDPFGGEPPAPNATRSRSVPSTRAGGGAPPALCAPPGAASAGALCSASHVALSPLKAKRRMRSNSRRSPVAVFTSTAFVVVGRRAARARRASACVG